MVIKTAHNSGLAKVAVQCSADTFLVKESSALHINICGTNRHLLQAANRYRAIQAAMLVDGTSWCLFRPLS
jgi:hypothetical protein